MFRCKATARLSRPNESARMLVTHVRNRTYFRWNRKTLQEEVAGHGTEIVREIMVLPEYYAEMMAKGFQPEVVKE